MNIRKYAQLVTALGILGILIIFHRAQETSSQLVVPIPLPTTPVVTIPTPQATTTVTLSNTPLPTSIPVKTYNDGTFEGSVEDAFYGNIQVSVTITNGKIVDVGFLQYPNDNSTSRSINGQALPILRSEVLTAQSTQVDGVSGASATFPAFQQSLKNALLKAKAT